MSSQNIAIIGAGLAGLTAAYELHKLTAASGTEAAISVFEADGRIGGKLHTVGFSDGPVDMGAEAFLARRKDMIDFVTELGLAEQLVHPSNLRPRVYTQGELHFLPAGGVMGIPGTPQDFFSAETNARIENEQPFAWAIGGDVSVGQLVRQQFGDEVADRVVSALLGGVYSCLADDLGLRATIPYLAAALDALAEEAADGQVTLGAAVRRIADGRTPAEGPIFASFAGGYTQLYDALAEASGADIYLDTFVSGITRGPEGFTVVGAPADAPQVFDAVLLATPAPTTARLLPKVAPEVAAELKKIKLASSVVVGFRFESATDPDGNCLPEATGVLVAADEPDMTAKAFTLSSNKWPHLGSREGFLVRASFGRFGDDAIVRADEDELVDLALDDLQRATGFDGRAAGISDIYTQRWFGGLPRYDETHLATVAAAREALAQVDGLEATGAWANGVGVPDVVADARAAAARLLQG